jgi:hypothetical protein
MSSINRTGADVMPLAAEPDAKKSRASIQKRKADQQGTMSRFGEVVYSASSDSRGSEKFNTGGIGGVAPAHDYHFI